MACLGLPPQTQLQQVGAGGSSGGQVNRGTNYSDSCGNTDEGSGVLLGAGGGEGARDREELSKCAGKDLLPADAHRSHRTRGGQTGLRALPSSRPTQT